VMKLCLREKVELLTFISLGPCARQLGQRPIQPGETLHKAISGAKCLTRRPVLGLYKQTPDVTIIVL
jgi:hypothetical protein